MLRQIARFTGFSGLAISAGVVLLSVVLPAERLPEPEPHQHKAEIKPYSAIVVGSTGAIGKKLVKELVDSKYCNSVAAVVRLKKEWLGAEKDEEAMRTFNITRDQLSKLKLVVVQYDYLDKFAHHFQGYDKGFCTLGTTLRDAGSVEKFRLVDVNYTRDTAQMMKDGGVKHFSIVTSIGANNKSSLYYPKAKGEIEQIVSEMKFDRTSIFRPGVLIADRTGSERLREGIATAVLPRISWLLRAIGLDKYNAVPVERVAKAMLINAELPPRPRRESKTPFGLRVETYENDVIRRLDFA